MKDYKEMTESVLRQANARAAQRTRQRRMATGLITVCLCLAILISVVGVGMNRTPVDDTQPTISMEDPAIDLKVVFLNTENGQETPLEFGVTMPIEYFVYVRDLRGLNEAQRREVLAEWELLRESKADGVHMTVSSGYEGENVLAATLTKGRLAIKFDTSKVAAAYVDGSNQEIANKSGYYSSNGQFCINWFLKGEVLEEDPGIPLSSIHDTLEIVVMYHDLTREVITLDVSLNDEGQVFITRIENKVSV